MTTYAQADLMRLARRHHNTRRSYLLVDPLQGKHMPVSPSAALDMMRALGARMIAARPDVDLVVGFAETATAVAAVAAAAAGDRCRYIHTTRERFPDGRSVAFREAHSHAVAQRLSLVRLEDWIASASAVAFVDDEYTTAMTLCDVLDQLGAACPALAGKPVVAASVIERLSDARRADLAGRNICCASLLRLPPEDYTRAVQGYDITGATPPRGRAGHMRELRLPPVTDDPRAGVLLGRWRDQVRACADELASALKPRLADRRVTVLGTEEYMLPALLLADRLESGGIAARVRFHATTRSPIGICRADGYPIQSGWQLRSFYEPGRVTYIYDLEPCEAAVVLTDSPDDACAAAASADLAAALGEVGCADVTVIREARHVQHV